MLVDYNDAIETSTGGRAEFVRSSVAGHAYIRIFEPFEKGYHSPGPGGAVWLYSPEGEWNGGYGHEIRIVNSARPNDNVPEEW